MIGVFLSENFGHFMPSALGGTGEASRPLWYIAARMFGGALPQSLLAVALAIALWRRDGDERARKPLLFQLSLALAVLVFFLVASSKRDDYILPAMPGLAILFAALFTGAAIAPERERSLSGKIRDLTAAAIACAFVASSSARWWSRVSRQPDCRVHRQDCNRATPDLSRVVSGGMRHLALPFAIFTVGSNRRRARRVSPGCTSRRPLWSGAGLAAIALAGSTLFAGTLRPELARAEVDEDVRGAGSSPRRRRAALHSVGPRLRVVLLLWSRNSRAGLRQAPRHSPPTGRYSSSRGRASSAHRAGASRAGLKLVMQSGLIGGGGPPAPVRNRAARPGGSEFRCD